MKNIFLFILVAMAISCSPSKQENDLEKQNLNGSVKSVRQSVFEAHDRFGEITKAKELKRYSFVLLMIFNKNGNEIERKLFNSDVSLKTKITFKYGDKDIKIEKNLYGADGSLEYRTIYKNDDRGNATEQKHYNSDGILKSTTICKYDDKNNEIEYREYRSDGIVTFILNSKYDEKNNVIEKETGFTTEIGSLFKQTSKYDDNHNEIEGKHYGLDGNLTSEYNYEYDFDQNNNWVRRIKFKNGIADSITEREIEYYD